MGKPHSLDLRSRVLAAVDQGESVDEVGERFSVTARTIWNWIALRKKTGQLTPRRGDVGPKRKLDAFRDKIVDAIRVSPSLTLDELREQCKLPGSRTTLWNALVRWGQTLKKSPVRGGAVAP
jgi:transposase